MALSEIKTNTQKGVIKDVPQTNGSYKNRHIVIKIMDYTHTHKHKQIPNIPGKIEYSRFTQ